MAIILTANKTTWRIGEEPPTFTASGQTGAVVWETNHGTLEVDDTGLVAVLSLPNRESFYGDDAVEVTATDDVGSAAAVLDAYTTFPFEADPDYEGTVNNDQEISQSEDNSESTRILSDLFASYPLTFSNRDRDEYRFALAFYAAHRRGGKWFYIDGLQGLEEVTLVRFDSEFKRIPDNVNNFSYGFALYTNNWPVVEYDTEFDDLPLYGEGVAGNY